MSPRPPAMSATRRASATRRRRVPRSPLHSRSSLRLNDACLALAATYASDIPRYAEKLEELDGDLVGLRQPASRGWPTPTTRWRRCSRPEPASSLMRAEKPAEELLVRPRNHSSALARPGRPPHGPAARQRRARAARQARGGAARHRDAGRRRPPAARRRSRRGEDDARPRHRPLHRRALPPYPVHERSAAERPAGRLDPRDARRRGAGAASSSSPVRSSPTSCWQTRSTAPARRRSRRCSRP